LLEASTKLPLAEPLYEKQQASMDDSFDAAQPRTNERADTIHAELDLARSKERNSVGARPEFSFKIDRSTLVILDCGFNDVV